MARLVLVAASERLPGLFPFHSWEALRAASRVVCRDPDTHPSAPHLAAAGLELVRLGPGRASLRGLDLTQVGSPAEFRAARGLLELAVDGEVTYLLGPQDGESFIRTVGTEAVNAGVEVEFVFHLEPPGTEVLRLAEVERALRDPDGGCPWDLEQDHRSLARHLVEETYELLDAIETGDDTDIVEELGDVLLQVVFHSQIAADRGAFTLDDVARGIADKLVRRHPHVFSDAEVADAAEVKANWETIKQQEKQRTGPFEGVPRALPALQLAAKIISRSARAGRPARGVADAAAAVARAARTLGGGAHDTNGDGDGGDEGAVRALGDLLLAAVELSRALELDPEQALRTAADALRADVEAARGDG